MRNTTHTCIVARVLQHMMMMCHETYYQKERKGKKKNVEIDVHTRDDPEKRNLYHLTSFSTLFVAFKMIFDSVVHM